MAQEHLALSHFADGALIVARNDTVLTGQPFAVAKPYPYYRDSRLIKKLAQICDPFDRLCSRRRHILASPQHTLERRSRKCHSRIYPRAVRARAYYIAARPQIDIPILRKDFTIDEFQLYESRAIGADAVLLIAAALPLARCRELAATAHRLGLEVLLEIHSEKELDYISDEVDMIGVNNRNLGTFDTRVGNSFRLAGQLPQDRLLVSESGISDPETVKKLREAGFRGFLIGENFMKTADPGYGLDTFIKTLNL